jgi:hypothetical protein
VFDRTVYHSELSFRDIPVVKAVSCTCPGMYQIFGENFTNQVMYVQF